MFVVYRSFIFKAVILLNVLSFYSPLREQIKNGVKYGLIQPSNENLIIFVDGPEDISAHATFDWGQAALKALESWKSDGNVVYSYDWTQKMGNGENAHTDKLDNA